MQSDAQLIGIGIKILVMFLEKGLVPPQSPVVEGLAAQARALPKLDASVQTHLDSCVKALNAAARYPEKEPYHAQVTKLNRKLAKRDRRIGEMRENMVPQSELSQMNLQLAEMSTRLQDYEAQMTKERETTKKLQGEKKQLAEELIAAKQKLADTGVEVGKLKTQVEKEISVHGSKQSDWQREVQKLKADLGKSAEQEVQKEKRIADLQAEIAKMKTVSAREQKAISELEHAVERVTHENSDISARYLALVDEHRVLQQDKQRLGDVSHAKPGVPPPPGFRDQNASQVTLLDSLNPSELSDMTELDTLEAMLEAKLSTTRLRKVKLQRQQLEALRELVNCPICMAKSRDVALTPCGHTFCADCARAVTDKQQVTPKKCPICRKGTKGTQPIYL